MVDPITDEQLSALDPQALLDLKRRITKRAVVAEMKPLDDLREEYNALMARIDKAVAPFGLSADGFVHAKPEEVKQYLLSRESGQAPRKPPGRGVGRRSIVPPRYQHPDTPSLAWTGRGAKPKWVRAYLEEDPSHTMEDLLIAKPAKAI